jgi:fructose/tagatose bisphosphate aldolase
MAFGRTLRETIAAEPEQFDRIAWFANAMKAVEETASGKLRQLGCQGRSQRYEQSGII